ncbi:MAG: isoprenylcysteine carboxylmethyltransferase family protein [Dehalococcoidales bacterium]|nr:isoprenylcysteine carboxylmethyltransferase family protein [Dehalococcoidales bacterium]
MDIFWDYLQIGILIAFTSLVLGRVIYERFRGINALALINNSGKQRVLGTAAVAIISLWVFILVMHITHPEIMFLPWQLSYAMVSACAARITGMILVIVGFVLYINAWRILGNAWRIGSDEKGHSSLVISGVYALSRNPIYVFYCLYFVGTFLMNGTSIFLILAILLTITLHHLIIEEEKFLAARYGNKYKQYQSNTRRYFTFSKLVSPITPSKNLRRTIKIEE